MPDIDTRPTRVLPVLNADGQPQELLPPAGGMWQRDTDGGLTPMDAGTAARAGLAWPVDIDEEMNHG